MHISQIFVFYWQRYTDKAMGSGHGHKDTTWT
jgi:hypothetical protein